MKIREILIWVAIVLLFAMCYMNMIQLNQTIDIIGIQQDTINKIIDFQKFLFNTMNSQIKKSIPLPGDFWVET